MSRRVSMEPVPWTPVVFDHLPPRPRASTSPTILLDGVPMAELVSRGSARGTTPIDFGDDDQTGERLQIGGDFDRDATAPHVMTDLVASERRIAAAVALTVSEGAPIRRKRTTSLPPNEKYVRTADGR